MTLEVTPRLVQRLRSVYERRTPMDLGEKTFRVLKERLCGVEGAVFEKPRRYYWDVKGQVFSREAALAKARNKEEHKVAWFARDRSTLESMRHFYQEVDVYPFRHHFLKRHGGFRWYRRLVDHVPHPSILEYGCGAAALTEWLVGRFPECRYSVADIPSTTLDFVRWKQAAYHYPYTILTIGPGREGIPLHEAYDLIICQEVLSVTPNPLEIVGAFVEHLSPGGVLVTDFMNAPGGENLPAAVEQREAVKAFLRETLLPVKAIDEPSGCDGLYVNGALAPRSRCLPSEETSMTAP